MAKKTIRTSIKIEDTVVVHGSKLHDYWTTTGFREFYKQFRKGLALPKTIADNAASPLKIQEAFKLKGFQFGNWLTNEDRYNYLAAIYICLYDLNKVLKFKGNNLGLDNNLIVSFGARGSSGALAHYESWNHTINMTRYKKLSTINKQRADIGAPPIALPKTELFVYTGGVGSFAHEYGHFLDYYFGGNYDVDSTHYSLSTWRSTSYNRMIWGAKQPLRKLMEDLLMKIIWKDEKKKVYSAYMKKLKDYEKSDYWFRRNELFARAFEQYISYKLSALGIHNKFLAKRKYVGHVYIAPKEFKAVVPYFDKLIRELRKYF